MSTDDKTIEAATLQDGPRASPTAFVKRYEIGAVIGRGGMGEVVSARDPNIGREVAIKRMRSAAPSERALRRFLREARVQGRLEHPAIAPVHEIGFDDDGQPYFTMKKLSGDTLKKILETRTMTRPRLLRALADVCLAVELAHTRGVIHRDLKPANIMLGNFGEVYVLDWGIARVTGVDEELLDEASDDGPQMTVPGAMIGTPGYMAPEQVRGRDVIDARVDVYALGCILYEILAGRSLHPQSSAALQTTLAVSEARPSKYADVPPELDELCARATALDRDNRSATARELGEAIQQFLDGDRDLAMRRSLAETHLAAAHRALASGDGEDERRVAMREAGRALALQPTLDGVAALVGKLIIDPPRTIPTGARLDIAAHDDEMLHMQARQTVGLHIGILICLAGFVAVGVRDHFYLPTIAALAVFNIACSWIAVRIHANGTLPRVLTIAMILGHAGSIAALSRAFTPFLVAPILAPLMVFSASQSPVFGRGRTLYFVALSMWLAAALPYALELFGVIGQTVFISGNTVRLVFPPDGADQVPISQTAAIILVLALAASLVLGMRSASTERRSRERVLVQQWHLRQLLT